MLNVTLAAITLAAAYAVYYIRLASTKVKKQTQQIEDESARLLLDNAVEDVRNLAETAVGAMEQTTAKALRDKVKIGKDDLNDLKADLPLIYVTREDFIRVNNNIDKKLDKLLYRSERREE